MFPDQRVRPLLRPQPGVFFYSHLGPLGVPSEGGEDRIIRMMPKCVVAPVASRDHAPIEVHDPLQLKSVESCNRAPVPRMGERRNDAQARLLLPGAASPACFDFTSCCSALSSRSSSHRRASVGSAISLHGVP